ASPERIRGILKILKGYYSRGEQFTVVFSAFSGVTDALLEMAKMAAKGDAAYSEKFEIFSKRHFEAARELLNDEWYEIVAPQLAENHEVLKSLLHGVFLLREASPRTLDYVVSFGARNAAFIIAHAFRQNGIPAAYLDARSIVRTDDNFGSAKVDFK